MNPIPVMMNGLPGDVATTITRHLLTDNRFRLIPQAFTGPEISEKKWRVDGCEISLVTPDKRDSALKDIMEKEGAFVTVDFTHPSAVNDNGAFYCRNGLPFVMGTTGGDRTLLEQTVSTSDIPALIAPNMAKQIVGFQAMMEYGARTFPELFGGYRLAIKESHQQGKADTSGTAKAMVTYFNAMGIPFTAEAIEKEREPQVQEETWGIPKEHLGGHAWHTYTLTSEDTTAQFAFTHNINGRDIYAQGTLDAIVYLNQKVTEGIRGRVYSMIDLLKGI